MNTKKLVSLAIVAWFTVAGAVAGNERGIDLYRAELYDAAKLFFLQQNNQSPQEQAETCYYLGQTYYALQKTDSAAYYYAKAIAADSEYPFGYIGEGKLALVKNDIKAAETSFKTAIGLAKKNVSVQTTIAEAYVDAGKLPQAEEALAKAEKINKKYSGIYMVRGSMALKEDKRDQAYSWYEQAIYFDSNDKVAYLKLAKAYEGANPKAALDYLDQLIKIDPDYIPAYALIGDINRENGMYYQALDAYEKFIAIPGVPIQQHERYAQLLYFTDQYEKSLKQIDYVLQQDPANAVMHRIQAYNYFKLGNTALTAQEMGEFLKNNPEDKHIYLDYITYGQALVKEKQPETAIAALQKAIVLDPTKAEVYRELASAYDGVNSYPEEIKMFEKYFELAAENAKVLDYFFYGQALYKAAIKYIDQEYVDSPITPEQKQIDDADFYSSIEKGNAAFSEVITRSPESHIGYLWRANLNALVDSKERETKTSPFKGVAKPYYEEALQVMLNNNAEGKRNANIIDAYDYLASYYLLLDDKVNAGEYYKKILEIDPANSKAITVLNQLKIKY
ncbi:MAG: tetratricopeptide repeat protein [Dysgonamonadaceae bacterium]|jgi:tetratricopeptide (TPR) repeat protein|nr:tetratricopeptide repeat protein [Dysgonamonadaceae bacterium]